MSDQRVVWHQYRRVKYGNFDGIEQVYCGGTWYEVGNSPCNVEDEKAAQGLASLPDCEVDDEDIAAMRELLQVPDRASICRQKGRASWISNDDRILTPTDVQAQVALMQNQIAQIQMQQNQIAQWKCCDRKDHHDH
jgi:hypothetical protein